MLFMLQFAEEPEKEDIPAEFWKVAASKKWMVRRIDMLTPKEKAGLEKPPGSEREVDPENPVPMINANPSIVLSGNGKRFGITRDQLSTHCLMLGSTGTGKTNAILHFVKQLKASMNSEDVMLVFDSKLDFVGFP